MRIFTTIKIFVSLLCAIHVAESTETMMKTNNFWDYSQNFFAQLLRQGRNSAAAAEHTSSTSSFSPFSTSSSSSSPTTSTITLNSPNTSTILSSTFTPSFTATTTTTIISPTLSKLTNKTQQTVPIQLLSTTTTQPSQNESSSHSSSTTIISSSSTIISASTSTTDSTTANTIIIVDTTTPEYIATTGEPRESPNGHEFVLPSSSSSLVKRGEKPQIKISSNISQNLLPLPPDANAALIKPTKYHYYPHNQHIYFLPECAIQQVCNAVYVRLNWTQPLCACSSRSSACSASLNSDDLHTTELSINKKYRKAVTLVKTCEPTSEMRICRATRDWSLLALQNIRTGKSHYLVICRCPETSTLEGPMSHDTPTYASVPGIRVYGMMCVDNKRRGRPLRATKSLEIPSFPWKKAKELAETAIWD